MKNQWGQDIEVGDIVGYVNKTGSFTERKIGVVEGFAERKGTIPETTLKVYWVFDGSYGPPADHRHRGTVGLRRVFKLDPASLHPYIYEALVQARQGVKDGWR